jgi:uncharacterized protein YycO
LKIRFRRRPDGPSAAYGDARGGFREGDLLCFRGRGFISATIRLATRSAYSHVGLVHLFEGHVYCLEAVASGVRLCRMSEEVRRYDGDIDYFEVVAADDAQRRGAVGFGFQQLGKPFDFVGLARFFLRIVFHARLRARSDDRFFCAELVARGYAAQGLHFAERPASWTSPSDLAASPQVRFLFRVRRSGSITGAWR